MPLELILIVNGKGPVILGTAPADSCRCLMMVGIVLFWILVGPRLMEVALERREVLCGIYGGLYFQRL